MMEAAGNDESSSSEAKPKTSRKRSRNLKERKAIRNYYEIVKKNVEETKADLFEIGTNWKEDGKFLQIATLLKETLSFRPSGPGSVLSKDSKFFAAREFLAANLVFKEILPNSKDPFSKLPKDQGVKCARKLSFFLRHGLKQGQYSARDGSVAIEEVERSLGVDREKLLVAINPEYDEGKKRRFVVMKLVHPSQSVDLRIAALGGHSVAVSSPPGHFILGKESLLQLCPLIHNTSAISEIQESGVLSQQRRQGGVNFCSKENNYRQKSSHLIRIDFQKAEDASKAGYTFFGNRFSEVLFGTGIWANGGWTGEIPLKYLTICQHKVE
jgi:hypothetical protein